MSPLRIPGLWDFAHTPRYLLEFSVLFPKRVKMNASPEADPGPPNHYDSGSIHHQEYCSTSPTVNSMLYTFIHILLFAARLPQAYNSATQEAYTRILWHTVALRTLSSVVVLKMQHIFSEFKKKFKINYTNVTLA